MKDFIKVELNVRVSGFDVNGDGTVQLQNISIKDNGELVKHTVKIHKNIHPDELSKVVGKLVKVENVKEYKNGYKTYFSGDNIKILQDVPGVEFDLKKEISLKVDSVVEKDKDTKLQSVVRNGNRTDLFNIKIKGVTKLQNLKGKNVVIKNVNVAKTDYGTFYSSNVTPLIIE